jgi:hypothetical protein
MLALQDVTSFQIPQPIVDVTLASLQEAGEHRCECLVLWTGRVETNIARITGAIVPEQECIKSEDGVGYFVSGEELFRINKSLTSTGSTLLVQVHSHPGAAYHSEADDRYAMVTLEGGLSLVVPNFGQASPIPSRWAVYRLLNGTWTAVSKHKAETLLTTFAPK